MTYALCAGHASRPFSPPAPHLPPPRVACQRATSHLEVRDPVALLESDLEHVQRADVGGQAREALLAAAAHAHQQGVPTGELQDAVDPADVSHRVFEQHLQRPEGHLSAPAHPDAAPPAAQTLLPARPVFAASLAAPERQRGAGDETRQETVARPLARAVRSNSAHQVHDCVDFIVTVQDVRQQLVQVSHVGYREVFGLADPVREVAKHIWFGKQELITKILEIRGKALLLLATMGMRRSSVAAPVPRHRAPHLPPRMPGQVFMGPDHCCQGSANRRQKSLVGRSHPHHIRRKK